MMICLFSVGTLGPNIGWHGNISAFSGAYFSKASDGSVFTLATSIKSDPSGACGATSLMVSTICSIGTLKRIMSASFIASMLLLLYSTPISSATGLPELSSRLVIRMLKSLFKCSASHLPKPCVPPMIVILLLSSCAIFIPHILMPLFLSNSFMACQSLFFLHYILI